MKIFFIPLALALTLITSFSFAGTTGNPDYFGLLLRVSGDNGFWHVQGESFDGENLKGLLAWNVGVAYRRGLIHSHSMAEGQLKENMNGLSYEGNDFLALNNPPANSTKKSNSWSVDFMGGLEFIVKGAKEVFEDNDKTTSRINYLEIPLYALYSYHMPDVTFYGGLGPFISFAVSAHYKEVNQGQTFKGKIDIGGDNGSLTRCDGGLTFTVGSSFLKHFDAALKFDLGIVDIEKQSPDDQVNTRALSLNVGYVLPL